MIATISSTTKRSSESNLKTVKKPSTQSSSRIRVILWGEKSNKSYSWVHEFNFVNILQPYYEVLQKVWSNPNVGPTHIFNATGGSCKVGVAKQEFLSKLFQSLSKVKHLCIPTKLATKHAILTIVVSFNSNFSIRQKAHLLNVRPRIVAMAIHHRHLM